MPSYKITDVNITPHPNYSYIEYSYESKIHGIVIYNLLANKFNDKYSPHFAIPIYGEEEVINTSTLNVKIIRDGTHRMSGKHSQSFNLIAGTRISTEYFEKAGKNYMEEIYRNEAVAPLHWVGSFVYNFNENYLQLYEENVKPGILDLPSFDWILVDYKYNSKSTYQRIGYEWVPQSTNLRGDCDLEPECSYQIKSSHDIFYGPDIITVK